MRYTFRYDLINILVLLIILTYSLIVTIGLFYTYFKYGLDAVRILSTLVFPDRTVIDNRTLLEVVNYELGLHLLLVGYEVLRGYVWELLTALFIHANIAHLILNIIALLIVRSISTALNVKNVSILKVFLTSGIIGNLVTAFSMPYIASLGASGGIFGIFSYLALKEYKEMGSLTLPTIVLIILLISSLPLVGYPNIISHLVGVCIGVMIYEVEVMRT